MSTHTNQKRFGDVAAVLDRYPFSESFVVRILRENPALSRRVLGRRVVLLDEWDNFILSQPSHPRPVRRKRGEA
jgi:hypothetical protein